MPNRKLKSAFMVAGAAVGVAAAATWLGKKRHLRALETPRESLLGPEGAELPVGRTGAALFADEEPAPRSSDIDLSLDDIWSSTPGIAEPEQSEGYDAVIPEEMGAVWIARATQTTHEHRPQLSDPSDVPSLEELISQSTRESARPRDEQDLEFEIDQGDDDDDDDVIGEDDLDEDELVDNEKIRAGG